MKTTINILQIIVSVLLITTILIQVKGAGLGSLFGGGGNFYWSKRGMEKVLFIATIVLAALFLLTSVVNLLV